MRRSLLLVAAAATVVAGLGQVPTLAGTPAVPATVTTGTAALYTSDDCGYTDGRDTGVWVFALDLTLALRVNGRQRTMSISSPWLYPPSWPSYTGGPRSVPCGYRALPTMSVAGMTHAGTDLAGEPVHGYCGGTKGLLGAAHVSCKLSIHGRTPFRLEMTLVDVYDSQESEHSAGRDLNSTFVVVGAQPTPSS